MSWRRVTESSTREAKRWRPVTQLLDRPEWYSAMYSLVAHRVHYALATEEESRRALAKTPDQEGDAHITIARREAVLLALGCAASIRHRKHPPLIRRVSAPWPDELKIIDMELFNAKPRVLPPLPRQKLKRVPWRYRVRHRLGREREFTRFLERTVEPSALILLAGIQPVEAAVNAKENTKKWSRRDLIEELSKAADDEHQKLDTDRLIATARERKGLDGRAYYNLACYYAQAGDLPSAREHLRAAVFAASGPARDARVIAARNDPTLQRALKDWDDADEVLRLRPTAQAPSEQPELEQIAAIGGFAKKLAERDIRTPETLAERLSSQRTRSKLAKDLDVEPQLLERWRGLLQLLEVDGIGPAQLNLLEAVGIMTVEALRASSPPSLHRRLVDANTARGIVRAVPSEATLETWRAASPARARRRRGPLRPRE